MEMGQHWFRQWIGAWQNSNISFIYSKTTQWWIPKIPINTLRPRKYGRHFAEDIFKCIFLNENIWISIQISLKFVPKGPINNIPALVQIMAGRRPGDKPLSELMMASLLTHICVTRPQWVNICSTNGLVSPGNRPLHEPILTKIHNTIWQGWF